MYNSEINVALSNLNPISLEAIGSVKLMSRIDTKYVLSANRLPDLLDHIAGKYNVLDINSMRTFQYHTTYFDTSDYFFYNQHVRGDLERHKIRYRKYESIGTSFLEIKKKTNKGRTIKCRIENNQLDKFDDQAVIFIKDHLPISPELIKPVLHNRFIRVTLKGIESKERLTIDYNISFTQPLSGGLSEMPYLAIVELKREGYSSFSPFKSLMKSFGVYPTGFSKYCIGNGILNDIHRRNRIKPKLLLIKRIENEYFKSIKC